MQKNVFYSSLLQDIQPLMDSADFFLFDKKGLIGLRRIPEHLTETENDRLANDTYLQSITVPARRLASAAVRLLVGDMLNHWQEPYAGIIRNENGQPQLSGLPYQVSLTHGGGYAAALLHPYRKIGIDLELVREKIRTVAPRLFTPDELENAADDLEKLTLIWSAKEVLYKIYGGRQLAFREHLRVTSFEIENQGELQAEIQTATFVQPCRIFYRRMNNLVLAYGYAENNNGEF
jgi:4'-phosphopantetheinyl transferase